MVRSLPLRCVLLAIFLNCCFILTLTSVALASDYWVIIDPYLSDSYTVFILENTFTLMNSSELADNQEIIYFNDEKYLMPLDYLNEINDCQNTQSGIRLGMFRSMWLLESPNICNEHLNRVTIFDMLSKHKNFDQTLWVSCAVSCVLGLFSMLICSIFPLFNILISIKRNMNTEPTSLFLWNSLAGIFHVTAILLFMIEYEFYIKSDSSTIGIDTKLVSTKQATLGWSFYLLSISLALIVFNILLSYLLTMFNRLEDDPTDQMEPSLATESVVNVCSDINDVDCEMVPKESSSNKQGSSSKKIKRMINLVY